MSSLNNRRVITRQVTKQAASDQSPRFSSGRPSTSGTVPSKLSDKLKSLEERLLQMEGQLRSCTDTMSTNFNTAQQQLTSEISSVRVEVSSITQTVIDLEKSIEEKNKELSSEIDAVRESVDKLTNDQINKKVSCDAVLFGVPSGESDLRNVFSKICESIGVDKPLVNDIFRTKLTTPNIEINAAAPIIIKFVSAYERNRVLQGFGNYRRRTHSAISLRSAGFDCNNFVYLHESLPPEKRKLLQAAIGLKRAKKIFNAFAYRGVILIRPKCDDDAKAIKNLEELNALCSTNGS